MLLAIIPFYCDWTLRRCVAAAMLGVRLLCSALVAVSFFDALFRWCFCRRLTFDDPLSWLRWMMACGGGGVTFCCRRMSVGCHFDPPCGPDGECLHVHCAVWVYS